MPTVGQRERLTQRQIVQFFQDELGYRYLGDWKDRAGNRKVEEDLLRHWRTRRGFDEQVISCALRELDQAAALFNSPSTAAGVLVGGSANGRLAWKDDQGRTLKAMQEERARDSQ